MHSSPPLLARQNGLRCHQNAPDSGVFRGLHTRAALLAVTEARQSIDRFVPRDEGELEIGQLS